MNSRYTFYPNGKRKVIDFEKVTYNTYKDVDVSMMEPIIVPYTDHIASDGVNVKSVIEYLMPYLEFQDAYIRISSGDSYNDGDLEVCYSKKQTDAEFNRSKIETQKHIFASWKEYNGKKKETEKNKQKTIDNLRKQAAKLGFDLTEKD